MAKVESILRDAMLDAVRELTSRGSIEFQDSDGAVLVSFPMQFGKAQRGTLRLTIPPEVEADASGTIARVVLATGTGGRAAVLTVGVKNSGADVIVTRTKVEEGAIVKFASMSVEVKVVA